MKLLRKALPASYVNILLSLSKCWGLCVIKTLI